MTNDDTEADLRRRTRALEAHTMDAVERLAGGIAHEFNNLLTSIKGLSSLALKELEPYHQVRPDLEEIERAAQRAATLTRELIAFSRRQVLKPEAVNLNEAVSGMEEALRALVGGRAELRLTRAPELPPVNADPAQLELVVRNLVANARDTVPDGGLIEVFTGTATVAEPHGSLPPGEYALLAVRDSGAGIPPENLDRAFEPFVTLRPDAARTGLGLATVYGIVRRSGGDVEVESRVGAGSTFRVLLPFADAAAAERTPADGAGPEDAGAGTDTHRDERA